MRRLSAWRMTLHNIMMCSFQLHRMTLPPCWLKWHQKPHIPVGIADDAKTSSLTKHLCCADMKVCSSQTDNTCNWATNQMQSIMDGSRNQNCGSIFAQPQLIGIREVQCQCQLGYTGLSAALCSCSVEYVTKKRMPGMRMNRRIWKTIPQVMRRVSQSLLMKGNLVHEIPS